MAFERKFMVQEAASPAKKHLEAPSPDLVVYVPSLRASLPGLTPSWADCKIGLVTVSTLWDHLEMKKTSRVRNNTGAPPSKAPSQ